MKRIFYGLTMITLLSLFSSCAQSDSTSPDTSGAVPYGTEGGNGTGVDTTITKTDSLRNNPGMQDNTTNGRNGAADSSRRP